MIHGAELFLASSSPRRRDLLASVGLCPRILGSAVDESVLHGEAPVAYALRVATVKARSAAPVVGPAWVLAADTVVAVDGRVLQKASDEADAHRMLVLLSGRFHTVHTALVLRGIDAEANEIELFEDVVSTQVRFRDLSNREIREYIATGEPMDKAGSYGIQGAGGALVAEVDGSYTNVVGLPLEETLRLLRLVGIGRNV